MLHNSYAVIILIYHLYDKVSDIQEFFPNSYGQINILKIGISLSTNIKHTTEFW